jgi:hypothetical protein
MNIKFARCVATICTVALTLAGCATASKDIAPTYVSPVQYQSYDCDQIVAEIQRISARVNQLGGRLDEASNNDKVITTVGVILFWPILFALGGTKQQEAEYARLKGEYDALEQQAVLRKCPGAVPPTTTTAGSVPTAAPIDASPSPAAVTPSPTATRAHDASGGPAGAVAANVPAANASTATTPTSAARPATLTPEMTPVSAPAPGFGDQPRSATALGVSATAPQVPSSSKFMFSAERYAKEAGCGSPIATMSIQSATSESFTITCSNRDTMLVRCGGDVCRELQ